MVNRCTLPPGILKEDEELGFQGAADGTGPPRDYGPAADFLSGLILPTMKLSKHRPLRRNAANKPCAASPDSPAFSSTFRVSLRNVVGDPSRGTSAYEGGWIAPHEMGRTAVLFVGSRYDYGCL